MLNKSAPTQDAVYTNYRERALQLEKEGRYAKVEFLSILTAMGCS